MEDRWLRVLPFSLHFQLLGGLGVVSLVITCSSQRWAAGAAPPASAAAPGDERTRGELQRESPGGRPRPSPHEGRAPRRARRPPVAPSGQAPTSRWDVFLLVALNQ